MKFVKEEKLYTVYEITKSYPINRQTLLSYESIGLLLPSYRDKDSGYRYYPSDVFIKLSKIDTLKNSGLTLYEIRDYFNNELFHKEDIKNELIKRREDINNSLLFLDNSIDRIYKDKISYTIYYYEYRNINKDSDFNNLFKYIYIHALEKDYIFANSFPFIYFLINDLSNVTLNDSFILKTRFSLPLTTKYDEKNIATIKECDALVYETSSTSFIDSLNKLKKIILNNNHLKFKGNIIYNFYNDDNLSVHKFILPLHK